jgi:dTDP-4-dehydrorhamnose reductase
LSSEDNCKKASLELWGGVECTINRVEEEYYEQLRRTGHVCRMSDLDRFAELGIKAMRQPILWECAPSHASDNERWNWANDALERLERLGIRPIVGLVHHGSGPRDTNLLDPAFATNLARYAEQVALRFPHVQDYTPINEPLTTARFSALYGTGIPTGGMNPHSPERF